jgi:hypothetical protein
MHNPNIDRFPDRGYNLRPYQGWCGWLPLADTPLVTQTGD